MTTMHIQGKTDGEGKLGIVIGVPNTEVNIAVSWENTTQSQEQWRQEMQQILDSMSDVHLEESPKTMIRDPWESA